MLYSSFVDVVSKGKCKSMQREFECPACNNFLREPIITCLGGTSLKYDALN